MFSMELNFDNFIVNQLQMGNSWDLMVPAWFVVMLFSACSIDYLVKRCIKINFSYRDIFLFIVYLILACIMIAFARRHMLHDWENFACRTAFALFFYHLGYLYNQYFERLDKLPGYLYFSIIFFVFFIIHLVYGQNIASVVYNSHYNLPPLQCILVAMCGIAFWLRVTRYFAPVLCKSKLFLFIGDHTFSIMIHHGLFIFLFKVFLTFFVSVNILPYFDLYEFRGVWSIPCPNGDWIRFFYAMFGLLGPCLLLFYFEKFDKRLKDLIDNKYHLRKIFHKSFTTGRGFRIH